LDGIFDGYVRLIAGGRKVAPDKVRQWIDKGLYGAEEAKRLKIIDDVEFRADFVSGLQKEYGEKIKFEKRYAKKKDLDIDFSSPFGILKFYADLLAGPRRTKSDKDAVAIVHVEGPILAGSADPGMFPFGTQGIAYSTPIRKALDEAAKEESIKAVVLRVNSPGGSAVGSEVILQATKRLKEEKPIVVSMGDVAGSGGYYVACGADTIYADPSTITASIGVVAGKLVTTDMWNKIGINWKSYDRGESSGILSGDERFSARERETLQSWMNEVYVTFKGHVTTIRGDRLKKDIEDLAGGRVYTGRQALELGLVDKLGGLDDAIHDVAQQAGLKEFDVRVVPRPKNLAELLRESLTGGDEDDEQTLSTPKLGRMSVHGTGIIELAMPALKQVDPQRAGRLLDALRQLEVLHEEHVSLSMPILHFSER
jgi:protease-4